MTPGLLDPVRPYLRLIGLVALLVYGGGMYWWGGSNARNACAAANGKASAKLERAEDKRDMAVEDIAAATAEAVARELNNSRSDADESAQRIRVVEVPVACRTVDPGIVRELREARDGVNAALGGGVRPASAGAPAANP